MTDSERYADKIAKLLRKAESTESQAEAEAFTAKAQELMTTYAIDEAMLAKVRGEQEDPEEVIEERIEYTGTYARARFDIGSAIAEANGCRVLLQNHYDKSISLFAVGFESDVHRAQMLDTSLQIQAQAALNRWWKAEGSERFSWQSSWERTKQRRGFLFGFANGLQTQLRDARTAGEAEAAKHEAERSDVSEAEASESVALVVRSRKDTVNDWVDKTYGTLRSSYSRYHRGGADAHGAGHAAGVAANTSTGSSIAGGAGGALTA